MPHPPASDSSSPDPDRRPESTPPTSAASPSNAPPPAPSVGTPAPSGGTPLPEPSQPSPLAPGAVGLVARYQNIPLYLRILVAMVIGLALGVTLGDHAEPLAWVSKVILRFLAGLAPALILVAVIDSILHADIKGRGAAKLGFLLVTNTLMAIFIGLAVANVLQPGAPHSLTAADNADLTPAQAEAVAQEAEHLQELAIEVTRELPSTDQLGEQLMNNLPRAVLEPLVTNNVIGVVILALTFGIVFRKYFPPDDMALVRRINGLGYRAIVIVLHWILELVPLAVLCTVAETVGTKGLAPLISLGWFILAVMLALGLQCVYYLTRIRLGSWVRPRRIFTGMRDALVMSFSTASSTATMPVTFDCLRDNVGVREESASMGALVGANFNNDGTALYEAMAALFVAQLIGVELSLGDQLLVVFMSVVASVGAAGIPEAGLVTMTLVFTAVHLPTEYIFLLLPVDWFLDRCRTAINVMGDVTVACLMDGKQQETARAP